MSRRAKKRKNKVPPHPQLTRYFESQTLLSSLCAYLALLALAVLTQSCSPSADLTTQDLRRFVSLAKSQESDGDSLFSLRRGDSESDDRLKRMRERMEAKATKDVSYLDRNEESNRM